MNNIAFEFEKKRDFGAIIGDSLVFFTRHFKSFLLGFLMYVGPFFLIGALAMIYAGVQFTDMVRAQTPGLESLFGMLVFVPFIVVATIMMIAFVCAMVQKYQRHLDEPLIEHIWPDIRKNLGPTTVALLTLAFLIAMPAGLLAFIGFSIGAEIGLGLVIFLLIPLLLYFAVVLTIFMVVHVLERQSIGNSLQRAFYLVRDKWWQTFAVYIVISILSSIASYIFMIPAYIMFIVQSLSTMDSGQISTEFGMWMGIMYACGFLGSLFASIYQTLGMIMQYYSLREQKDGVGLFRRIQELDKPLDEPTV